MKSKISRSVIPRLSVYYRALLAYNEGGVISSGKLSGLTEYSAAQIRRDLAYFGQFGTPGRGYVVSDLKKKILEILGIDKMWNVALVGVGNLGMALLSYRGFREQGFNIVAAFDNDPGKTGRRAGDVVVKSIDELHRVIRDKKIRMVIIAAPAKEANSIIESLVKSGIKAILNFAPTRPHVPKSVEIVNIDLSIELEKLAHFLGKKT